MKYRIIVFIAFVAVAFAACDHKSDTVNISLSPDAGTKYKQGDEIPVKVNIPSSIKVDSIVYLMDSIRITSCKDTLAAKLKTDSIKLGFKLITARVYSGGKPTEASTNILLVAAKAPQQLGFTIEKSFHHDTTSYTEGLQYVDGVFYESTGEKGKSHLLKTDLNGKILQSVKLDSMYFGEGIAVIGNKIIQLTWQEKVAFIYDKTTFKKLQTINYNWGAEGWGMAFDGTTIYNDDKTNRIFLLNKDTYQPKGFIDVYDDKGPVDSVNELEYIDGKIYANIYTTDYIIVIDPKTGAVLQKVDLTNLYPMSTRPLSVASDPGNNVLNGIAWDAQGKRLFITGKKWDKMFQVKFTPKK